MQTATKTRTKINFASKTAKIAYSCPRVGSAWYRVVPGNIGFKKETFSVPSTINHPLSVLLSPSGMLSVTLKSATYFTQKCHNVRECVTMCGNVRLSDEFFPFSPLSHLCPLGVFALKNPIASYETGLYARKLSTQRTHNI